MSIEQIEAVVALECLSPNSHDELIKAAILVGQISLEDAREHFSPICSGTEPWQTSRYELSTTPSEATHMRSCPRWRALHAPKQQSISQAELAKYIRVLRAL